MLTGVGLFALCLTAGLRGHRALVPFVSQRGDGLDFSAQFLGTVRTINNTIIRAVFFTLGLYSVLFDCLGFSMTEGRHRFGARMGFVMPTSICPFTICLTAGLRGNLAFVPFVSHSRFHHGSTFGTDLSGGTGGLVAGGVALSRNLFLGDQDLFANGALNSCGQTRFSTGGCNGRDLFFSMT